MYISILFKPDQQGGSLKGWLLFERHLFLMARSISHKWYIWFRHVLSAIKAYAPIVRKKLHMLNLGQLKGRQVMKGEPLSKFKLQFEELKSANKYKINTQRQRNENSLPR